MKRVEDWRKVLISVVFLLLFLSLLLQGVGYVTPGWRVTEGVGPGAGDSEVRLGLWYVTGCKGDNCDTYRLPEYDDKYVADYENYMLEYRIMTTIALFCCLVSLVAAIVWRNYWAANPRLPVYVCIPAAVISGILCLVCTAKMATDQRNDADDYEEIIGRDPFNSPYSLILVGVGGVIMIIAVILCFIIQCLFFNRNKLSNEKKQKPIPMKEPAPVFVPVEKIHPYNRQSAYEYENNMKVVPIAKPLYYKPDPVVVKPPHYTTNVSASQNALERRSHIAGDVYHVKYDPGHLGTSYSLSRN